MGGGDKVERFGAVEVRRYEFADMLRAVVRNAGCVGVAESLRFAVANLTPHERKKLVALCQEFGLR